MASRDRNQPGFLWIYLIVSLIATDLSFCSEDIFYQTKSSEKMHTIKIVQHLSLGTEINMTINCHAPIAMDIQIDWHLFTGKDKDELISFCEQDFFKYKMNNITSGSVQPSASYRGIVAPCVNNLQLFVNKAVVLDQESDADTSNPPKITTKKEGNHLLLVEINQNGDTAPIMKADKSIVDSILMTDDAFNITLRTIYAEDKLEMRTIKLVCHGVITFIYIVFAVLWVFLSAQNKQYLLNVHYLIGAVIALGLASHFAFLVVNLSMDTDNKAETTPSNVVFFILFLVLNVKSTFDKILVILLSLGYGLIKKDLGKLLYVIIGVSIALFLLLTLENCLPLVIDVEPQYMLIFTSPVKAMHGALFVWIVINLLRTRRALSHHNFEREKVAFKYYIITLFIMSLALLVLFLFSLVITTLAILRMSRSVNAPFCALLVMIMFLWSPSHRYKAQSEGGEAEDYLVKHKAPAKSQIV